MSSIVADRHRRELGPEVVDEPVEAEPARGLDQDDVAGARGAAGGPRGRRRRSATSTIRPGASPAARAPSAIGRAPGPTTTAGRPRRGRRVAHRAGGRPRGRRRARASRRGPPPPAGQAGQQVQGGAHRGRGGVVAVVQDGHVAETDRSPRCGAASRPARPAAISSSVEPGGEPDGRRGQRVVDGVAAEAGHRDRPARRPASAGRSACRPTPADSTCSRADVGAGAEAVGQDRGRRSRAAIRATRSSSALRTAVPSAGSASTSSPLARSIASIEPIRRQVDRLDGGHHADPRLGRSGQVGDLAADVHAHLEDERPRAPVRGAGGSAAGRSRCSRCPRCGGSGSGWPRTAAIASLVEVLAMLPVMPDDERLEPAPPAGRNRAEGASGSARGRRVTSPQRLERHGPAAG